METELVISGGWAIFAYIILIVWGVALFVALLLSGLWAINRLALMAISAHLKYMDVYPLYYRIILWRLKKRVIKKREQTT